ncbi:alpha/beta hydrolase [Sphingomonas metalli]|uniref:Alpha/beta hydrolase n=1 Tax=Sphingomonas metalli TaxID=1779358 RepID=A0A916SUA1_9SPHN|nr:alpha/beta fold hydrolase [Sphingomonas metalli]GGB17356.1 alpha/beta hydrolase [Sphingomonas metalli]
MLRSETAATPDRLSAALRGLAAYQAAGREPPPPSLPLCRTHGQARLTGLGGGGRPVVLIPSLINPSTILDLSEDVSLLRWLSTEGWQAWLLDWGVPTPDERGRDIIGHVETLLVPLLAGFERPPVAIGYCLGGTIAWAAAARLPLAGVATIAAPWRFSGYGDGRAAMVDLWQGAKPSAEALGLVPMEVLQAGFWRLDPKRTVDKYVAFADLAPNGAEARAFVRLEDWANAGAPLTYAAGRELFEDLVAADRPGCGSWSCHPATLPCPTVEFVSTTDRIVPAATAAGLADRRDVQAGHVGMIVGRQRHRLWQALHDWIAALPATR